MKIADVHAHIFPDKIAEKASAVIGGFYDLGPGHIATLENLRKEKAKAGISVTAVSSSATSPTQVRSINQFISACADTGADLVGFGSLFPTMENWEEELEYIQTLNIKGIKIHPDFQKVPIDEPKAIDMYRAIAKAGIPVLFHMGDAHLDYSTPQRLTNLIRQVPDLVAIAAHFGGWQSWDRAYEQILPENVYYDTSSAIPYLGIERSLDFLDKLGAHRFLFGTDFPMCTPEEELAHFLSLGLDEQTRNTILFDNFRKLFLA